jgi:hypothetical protein
MHSRLDVVDERGDIKVEIVYMINKKEDTEEV